MSEQEMAATEQEDSLSLDQLKQADGVVYETVKVYGSKVTIGSLGSGAMLDWLDSNESTDKNVRREAGLRIIVRAVVDGKTKARIPKEDHDKWMDIFRAKDAQQNGLLVQAILKQNGLGTKAKELAAAPKDDSSATATGDSPSA